MSGLLGGINKMKRIFVILIILTLLLTSCNPVSYFDWDDNAERVACEVIEYLDKGDREKLKDMFCNYTIENTKNLDDQIEDVISCFEGNVTNVGKILISGEDAIEGFRFIYIRSSIHVLHIETDNGKNYEMAIHTYLLNVKDKNKEGISLIKINETNLEWNEDNIIRIGEYAE
jgi:hypothetical protein